MFNTTYDAKSTTAVQTPTVRPFLSGLFRATPLYLFVTGLRGALRDRQR